MTGAVEAIKRGRLEEAEMIWKSVGIEGRR